jgi:hypothetical protein
MLHYSGLLVAVNRKYARSLTFEEFYQGLPPTPSRPPRDQQGNLVLQPGDCCLLILQRPCIKWWGGGFSVCVSVCARMRNREQE